MNFSWKKCFKKSKRSYKAERFYVKCYSIGKSTLSAGRLWFHSELFKNTAGCEWYFGRESKHCSIGLRLFGEEEAIAFNLCIPYVMSLYFHIEKAFPQKMQRYLYSKSIYNGLTSDIRFFENTLWVQILTDDTGYASPKFQNSWNLNLKDLIFGSETVVTEDLGTCLVEVPMPEKTYVCECKATKYTAYRKRFSSESIWWRVDLDSEEGIPHPGKGSTDYNYGTDATFSISAVNATIQETVNKLIDEVMYCRANYPQ